MPTPNPSSVHLLRHSPLPQRGDALIYGACAAGAVLLAIAFWLIGGPAWSVLRPMADIAAARTSHVEQVRRP